MTSTVRRFGWITVLGLGLIGLGCDSLAIRLAPAKTANQAQTQLSAQAKALFWDALHGGHYDRLPEVRRLLTAAYLENPRHPEITLLLAHAHLWTLAERARLPEVPPGITDHAILAEKYFTEAHRLNPSDDRIPGWLGGVKLALGQIHQDEGLTREGYFMLHDAIRAFPEFNDFSAGYVLSSKPGGDDTFREGLADMWDNLDRCAGERIDRTNPDYRTYMAQETQTGPKRVCWNSWIAPHNFEGFFLNMGDMLVKDGQPAVAKQIYAIAKLSKVYESWPDRPLLERRLAEADQRAQQFRTADLTRHPEILFNSARSCTACHQQ
jgi:hypothetical protein